MTRYYDPLTHRFVNADGYFQSGSDILDANMNAYCRNNPVNFVDPMGTRCWNNGTMKVNCHVGSDGFCYSCYSYDCCNPVERENSKGSGGKSVSIIGGRTSSSTNYENNYNSNVIGGTYGGQSTQINSNSSGGETIVFYYDVVNIQGNVGMEIHIADASFQVNLGIEDTGLTFGWGDSYFSANVAWDKLQGRLEVGKTTGDTTNYSGVYLNGYVIAGIASLLYGVPLQSQGQTAPAH